VRRSLAIAVFFFMLSGVYAQAASEPLLLALGAQVGMQEVGEGRVWAFGPIAEFGPPSGAQIRLGAELGLLGDASLTQLETLVLFNLQFGARIYVGAGVGISWSAERVEIPLLALAGLKTRPAGPWTFAIEGMLLAPVDLQRGFPQSFALRLSAGVLFSL
jgi:hypothetical protein